MIFRFSLNEKVFPVRNRFLGQDTEIIKENWNKLKSIKFQTESHFFKPYNLMQMKMKSPLDAETAALLNEEHIYQKIQLDHAFMENFAHPIPEPNSAMLIKVNFLLK